MAAYQGNLCAPEDEDPEAFRNGAKFSNFDVVVVGMGFHHFDDPELAARRLTARLRPGGVLVVVDFAPHAPIGIAPGGQGGEAHVENAKLEEAQRTVVHHGFSEEQIRKIFVGAGAGCGFALVRLGQVTFGETLGKRSLFLARGTKS